MATLMAAVGFCFLEGWGWAQGLFGLSYFAFFSCPQPKGQENDSDH